MTESQIHRILDGDFILFLGAGFSLGAVNELHRKEFKGGRELRQHLANEMNFSEEEVRDLSLHDLAGDFIEEFGPLAYLNLLNSEFTVHSVSDQQKFIGSLPWKRVYTTNYDSVFEFAAAEAGVKTTSFDLMMSGSSKMSEELGLNVIHFNGLLNQCTVSNVEKSIKLSFESSITESVADGPTAYSLQQDLLHSEGCVVLGYTFPQFDIDITRLFVARANKDKTFFFSGELDGRTKRRVDRIGVDMTGRTSDFIDLVRKGSETWKKDTKVKLYSLCPKKPRIDGKGITGLEAAFKFFALGDSSDVALSGRDSVIIKRSAAVEATNLLEDNKILILHSFFGNGKTVLTEQIMDLALEKGFKVYVLSDDFEFLARDFETLIRLSEKKNTLIVIEEYTRHLEFIAYAQRILPPHIKLLLTERTGVKEVMLLEFGEDSEVKESEVADLPCDTLDKEEIQSLIEVFDRFGLWQEKLEPKKFVPLQSKEAMKFSILTSDCSSQFCSILLHILKSEQIKTRLGKLFNPLYEDPEMREILISLCILILNKTNLSIPLLNQVCGKGIAKLSFKSDERVVQLIDISSQRIKFRSAITAEYLLENVCDFDLFFEVLEKVFLALDRINVTIQVEKSAESEKKDLYYGNYRLRDRSWLVR